MTYYKPIDSSKISFNKQGGAMLKQRRKCNCGCKMKIERRGGRMIETCPCKK